MFPKNPFSTVNDSFMQTSHISKITINHSNQDYILDRNTYNPSLLSEHITKTDYDKIIDNAEKVISQSMISKRKYEEVRVPRLVYVLFFTAIISFIIYMLTLYYAPRKKNGKTLYTISIVFAIIGICIGIGLSLYNICRKIRTGKDLNDFVEHDLKMFFAKVNESISHHIKFEYNKNQKVIECFVMNNNEQNGMFEMTEKGNKLNQSCNSKKVLFTEMASLMGNEGKKNDRSESLKGESGSEMERNLNHDNEFKKIQNWYKNKVDTNNNKLKNE